MDNCTHVKLKVIDRSYVSFIKKEIKRLSEQVGFTPYKLAELDIVVAELISNILKHAREGELLVKIIDTPNLQGLELISVDRGPGMANAEVMLTDGASSTNTLGQGLGSIKRLSDVFEIYSLPQWGTILLSRMYINKPDVADLKDSPKINALMIPKPGETECGDGWYKIESKRHVRLIALDGLGHGPEAAKAVYHAVKEFKVTGSMSPDDTVQLIHKNIRSTRGAVGMVLHLDKINNSISYVGLGNISARIIGYEKIKSLMSYNGIIGHSKPNTIKSYVAEWHKNETLIVHSDGLKSRWDLNHLPNIMNHDGSVIAAALYKDFSRNTDDLLIIVTKN